MPLRTGIDKIIEERGRQRRRWPLAHDRAHVGGELLQAARCYLWAAQLLSQFQHTRDTDTVDRWLREPVNTRLLPEVPTWPFETVAWRPGRDAGRCLEKAGALIAAELDRLHPSHDSWGVPLRDVRTADGHTVVSTNRPGAVTGADEEDGA